MSFTLIILCCSIRIAWLALDPFLFRGYQTRSVERLLAEVPFSILFSVYQIILIVWYSLYEEISTVIRSSAHKILFEHKHFHTHTCAFIK